MSTPTLLMAAAALGLVTSLLVSSNAMAIGTALGLLDKPDGARKLHARPTPLVGGFAVAGAAIAGAMLALSQAHNTGPLWLALAVGAMFIVGVIDDRRHLPPLFRLAIALVVLGSVAAIAPDFQLSVLRFSWMSSAFVLGGAFGLGFTILCLVGLLNAINLADGKNGIVTGMGIVWTIVLAVHAPPALWPVLLATGAALAVTWGFNMAGKLFLGDGGSYALSALFGLLAILVYNSPGAGAPAAAMFADDVALLFAIPVFDTFRLMAARVAAGRSPFHADRDHLHHHVYARIGWPRGLGVYLALVALPNAAALAWPGTAIAWLAVSFIGYAVVMAMTRFTPAGRPAE